MTDGHHNGHKCPLCGLEVNNLPAHLRTQCKENSDG